MNNEGSQEERPPGGFPLSSRSDWQRAFLEKELEKKAASPLPEELAGLIEQAMRDGGPKPPGPEVPIAADGPGELLPDQLIVELSAARERARAEQQLTSTVEDKAQALSVIQPPAALPQAADGFRRRLANAATTFAGIIRQLRRWLRPRDWHCRYLAVLSFIHRHAFDRRIERLLFIKTSGPHSGMEKGDDGQSVFRYRGPIPGVVLNWALSASPADLKRYAFVDFRAGNGRTLLLAAARNFEHATGYAYDSESCAVLEMNLAQYSRSYMACRDVRALRGDRDGISIPSQPAVLFFPDSLSLGHLGAVLSHLSASLRQSPRPIYLIFENSGPERGRDQIRLFRKLPLPVLNRMKARLFSPSNIAVYKSLNSGGVN